MSIIISQAAMQADNKKTDLNCNRNTRQRVKVDREDSDPSSRSENLRDNSSESDSMDSSDSSGWSSEVIEPAIKTMIFRARRGTRMKELMKANHQKNNFQQDRYRKYFGGGLNQPEDSEDEQDYEASSSGRDEFDSDFDLTDSYAGKRGRKKGTKINRKRKPISKTDYLRENDGKPTTIRRGLKKIGQELQESSQRVSSQKPCKMEEQKQEGGEAKITVEKIRRKRMQIELILHEEDQGEQWGNAKQPSPQKSRPRTRNASKAAQLLLKIE